MWTLGGNPYEMLFWARLCSSDYVGIYLCFFYTFETIIKQRLLMALPHLESVFSLFLPLLSVYLLIC